MNNSRELNLGWLRALAKRRVPLWAAAAAAAALALLVFGLLQAFQPQAQEPARHVAAAQPTPHTGPIWPAQDYWVNGIHVTAQAGSPFQKSVDKSDKLKPVSYGCRAQYAGLIGTDAHSDDGHQSWAEHILPNGKLGLWIDSPDIVGIVLSTQYSLPGMQGSRPIDYTLPLPPNADRKGYFTVDLRKVAPKAALPDSFTWVYACMKPGAVS